MANVVATVLGPNGAGTLNVFVSEDGVLRMHGSISKEALEALRDEINEKLQELA